MLLVVRIQHVFDLNKQSAPRRHFGRFARTSQSLADVKAKDKSDHQNAYTYEDNFLHPNVHTAHPKLFICGAAVALLDSIHPLICLP